MMRIGPVFVAFALAGATGCYVDPTYPGYGDDTIDDGDPSAAYLATTSPTYYDGRATYWDGNHWRYREGGRWGAYRQEPAGLRQYRGQGYAHSTRRYEGGGGRAHFGGGHFGGGGHGGGGHGGGGHR